MPRLPLSCTDYDELFKAAAAKHMPFLDDWRWLKAQSYQESVFNPRAESPVGAKGLMQIMPGTWSDIGKLKGRPSDAEIYNPEANVFAGAWYMAQMWSEWKSPRPFADRLALSLASYNAGLGNILKAQKHAGNPNLYSHIILGLPFITGDNARETIGYSQKIFGYYNALVLGI